VTDTVAPIDIVGQGKLLLANVVEELLGQGLDVPERQGLVPGFLIAWDDEQLVVNFGSMGSGQPGRPVSQGQSPYLQLNTLEFEVTLLRLISTSENNGAPPAVDTMLDEFTKLATDAQALWAAMVAIHRRYKQVRAGMDLTFGPLVAVGPQGLLAGCRCPISWTAAKGLR